MICIGLLYLTNFISTETEEETKVGFFNVNDKEQNMSIDVPKSFRKITEAYLMEKANTDDETDYISTKSVKKYCRTYRDKKDWENYKKELVEVPNTSERYTELRNTYFKTIYIDMKGIPANKDVTYTIQFKTDAGQDITTRPFHYSEERNRWQFGVAGSDKKSYKWWYIGGAALAVLVIGIAIAAFS